jgi:hypothetical protein
MLTHDEHDRLERLIVRFNYGAARSILLEAARPCVSLFLDDIPADPQERAARPLALGASRMGGAPDLPRDFPWPIREDGFVIDSTRSKPGYAGFLLQLALADMPRVADHPLPDAGYLYVFDLGPSQPFDSSFLVSYSAAAAADLRRAERPTGLPCAAELYCFEDGESFAIRGTLGIDFPVTNADGVELYRLVAQAMGVDDLAEGLIKTFSAFERHALDADADARAKGGYPDGYWRVGRLFGAAGLSQDGRPLVDTDGNGALSPLLVIESNTLVGYSSPSDDAPIQLLMPSATARPWTRFERVVATMTM